MFHIRIIATGKLKEQYWRDAEQEYIKRLSPYAKIEIIELKEESFKNIHDKKQTQLKEAAKIKKYLNTSDIVIALTERGKKMNSPQFATWLEKKTAATGKLTLLIGGPLGFHPSVLTQVHAEISLSELTFPHQMVRTILLEQLYRAITIIKGKQYHY
jgi:23S rRNA (pseudouridine1915-N3)-methyltransferase